MNDKIIQRLFKTNSVQSPNQDVNINLHFDSDYKELPYNEISEIVNAFNVFTEERNASDKYRLISTIRLLASNALPNIFGNDSLSIFDRTIFRNQNILDENIQDVTDVTDLTYEESYNQHFREIDGWFGYYDPNIASSTKCKFIDMEPKRTAFNIVHSADTNWYFYVTYPHSIDDTHELINGGLLVVDTGSALIGGVDRLILTTALKHNLVAGNKVRLKNAGSYDGDYSVLRVGYDNGDLREYSFVIDLEPNTIFVGIGTLVRISRIYYGTESKYYFRKFKTITETNDYEVYDVAYSQSIYGDKVSQLIFNSGSGNTNDIQIGELRDNLGRPLTELYITAIKGRPYSGGVFSQIKSGILLPLIGGVSNFQNVPDIRRIHNVPTYSTPSHIALENNITPSSVIFYGDVVEYNPLILKEFVLAEVHHRFNTNDRDTMTNPPLQNTPSFVMGPRPEGYMYKAHFQIPIRQLSSYIEQGDSSVEGIPDYATSVGLGRYIWREILSLGFNDGGYDAALDYPFLNGAHYIHTNICLNVRRQDPFNQFGLYYGLFPRDPFGDRIDTNNLDGKAGDYVC